MPAGMTRELGGTTPSSGNEEEEKSAKAHPCLLWTGGTRKIPVLIFHAEAILTQESSIRGLGERYHLAYKIVRTDSRLVRRILGAHGFQEAAQNSNEFNLMWTGSHLKPYLMRNLQEYQKVNHFPRSFELTRKDRLYKNVHRMQQSYGSKNFHFLPQTFMLPAEYQDFCNAFAKDRGPWIVKPVASSRGRGVYLINSPTQISLEENILVSRYISQPLLIDDFKFDVRLYVLVTSFDPLVIYLYEEGLARFATVRYDKAAKYIKNQFMHLTNYSVNKKSGDYVSCDDPEVEDYGNKWSMSAMLRYLKQEGTDTAALMAHVEDLIIKTVISGEMAIATACKTCVPHRGICFELYGFDVLIDANLKPWLLEVNLSPSLACDAPLDLKVKASMLSDMFTLVGLVCHDPTQHPGRNATLDATKRSQLQKAQRPSSAQTAAASTRVRQRPLSASDADINVLTSSTREKMGKQFGSMLGLTMEEIRALRKVTEEWQRRGGFIRIFPRVDTWELYGPYLEYKTTLNYVLATHLFTDRGSKVAAVGISKVRSLGHGGMEFGISSNCCEVKVHTALYERKLLSLEARRRRRHHGKTGSALVRRTGSSKPTAAPLKVELENEEEEEAEDDVDEEINETPCIPTIPPEPERSAQSVLTAETTSRDNTRKETHGQSTPEQPPVNLMKVLQENCNLSKVQARMAFSAYLQRVQQRLNTEFVGQSKNCTWAAKEDDQMDLVVRFLKRAASNLQPPLRMVLPGRRLPLMDRRRILAYQLGEFIQHYTRETDHMIQKKLIMAPHEGVEEGVNPQEFQTFVMLASESELEEVLTFYTQKNKSASVFLGTNSKITKSSKSSNDATSRAQEDCTEKLEPPKESHGREESSGQTQAVELGVDVAKAVRSTKPSATVDEKSRVPHLRPPSTSASGISGHRAGHSLESSHPSTYESSLPSGQKLPLVSALPPGPGPFTGNALIRMPSSTSSPSPGQTAAPSGNWAYPTTASASLQATNPERLQQSRSGIMMATSLSSLHSAAQIYSQRLCRPSSAKAVRCQQSASRHRPGIGSGLKDREDSISQTAACDHSAVTTALQRLVDKQASRQYAASSHLGFLTQQLTNLNLASGALSRVSGPYSAAHRPSVTTGGPVKVLHSDTQEDSAHTPPRLRAPQSGRPSWDGQVESSAYSAVTGVSPQQRYQPTTGSYQLQYAMQQLELQRLQSRQLLDQSRARHQVAFTNQQLPSSSQGPVLENCSAQWTANLPLSSQKVGTLSPGESSSHHVPKPPVNHKQVLLRKTATQRTAKVSSVNGRPDGFQTSLTRIPSSESIPSCTDAKQWKEQIMATNYKGTSPASRNEVLPENHMSAPGQRIEFLSLKRK